MKKGMLLKKKISHHNPDIYILVKGVYGREIIADMYLLSNEMEQDRRIRGVLLPAAPLVENFRVIHPFSPEMDLVRSLFRLPSRHSEVPGISQP